MLAEGGAGPAAKCLKASNFGWGGCGRGGGGVVGRGAETLFSSVRGGGVVGVGV